MDSQIKLNRSDARRHFFYVIEASVVSLLGVLALCAFFAPRWETNDDVALSMIAHGYGIAATSSAKLFFSNVVWGYFVQSIPTLGGVLGYSIATFGVLCIAGSVIYCVLRVLGHGYLISLSVFLLLFCRPILFPQFTINSGLLMLAAVACWHVYKIKATTAYFVIGCLLTFVSYLIRSHEALLVFLISLPFFPWRILSADRSAKFTAGLLIASIAVAATLDYKAYQAPDWSALSELNPVRAQFTDYGARGPAMANKPLLDKYGLSVNDIQLVSEWFFVDPSVADPQKLRGILNDLGPLSQQSDSLPNAWIAVSTFWNLSLLCLSLSGILLIILFPTWQTAFSWMLSIAAVIVLGLLGRPGIVRVYIPVVSALVLVPFLTVDSKTKKLIIAKWVLTVAAVVALLTSISMSSAATAKSRQIKMDFAGFTTQPVVIWGSSFPFEDMYPALRIPSSTMLFQFYGLGTTSLAPYSVVAAEERAGRNFRQLLSRPGGMPIMADDRQIQLLDRYCKEHMAGDLKETSSRLFGANKLRTYRCVADH